MKNIHLLQTSQPSRLWITKLGSLTRCHDTNPIKKELGNNMNIYITSDEEIKEGDWVYCNREGFEPVLKQKVNPMGVNNDPLMKKIILTTDQDLIKDGIQVIDDEFLEWFVENPSCEYVEVQESSYQKNLEKPIHKGLGVYRFDEMIRFLKIIIPQEETKQENRKICKCKRAYENPLSEICSLCWNELYPNEKDEIKEEDLLEPKQETLEIKDGNQPAYQFDEWNTLFELQSQCRKIGLSELEIHSVLSNRFELKKRNNI
jgi:hypothetical protein